MWVKMDNKKIILIILMIILISAAAVLINSNILTINTESALNELGEDMCGNEDKYLNECIKGYSENSCLVKLSFDRIKYRCEE